MQSLLGSSTDGATPVFAARCTVTSAPSATRRASRSSSMSPKTSSTGSPDAGKASRSSGALSTYRQTASRSSRSPTDRSSTTLTACPPSSTRDLTKAVPRKSEEHTSELQPRQYLVCRLLLEKKKPSVLQSSKNLVFRSLLH